MKKIIALFVGLGLTLAMAVWVLSQNSDSVKVLNPSKNLIENNQVKIVFEKPVSEKSTIEKQIKLLPLQPGNWQWENRKTLIWNLEQKVDQPLTVIFGALNLPEKKFYNEMVKPKLSLVIPRFEEVKVQNFQMVSFIWDQPIFTLRSPADAETFLSSQLKWEPNIEGAWRQVGTTGFVFEPKETWQPSTRYTIKGLKNVLGKNFEYEFETIRLDIESVDDKKLLKKNPLVIRFNQGVNIKDLLGLKLVPEISFDLEYDEGKEPIDHSVIHLIPRENWPEDTSFKLILPQDTKAKWGDLKTENSIHKSFQTQPKFSINYFIVPEDITSEINISFSSPVYFKDLKNKTTFSINETNIDLEPLWRDPWGSDYDDNTRRTRFSIGPPENGWPVKKSMKLQIGGSLKDALERPLKKAFNKNFTVTYKDQINESLAFESGAVLQRNAELFDRFWYTAAETMAVNYTLKRILPNEQNWQQTINHQPTEDPKEVHTLFTDLFGSENLIDESGLVPGIYEFKVTGETKNKKYAGRYVRDFVVSDLNINVVSEAKNKWRATAKPFPGERPLQSSGSVAFYRQNYKQPLTKITGKENEAVEVLYPKYIEVQSGNRVGYLIKNHSRISQDQPEISVNQRYYLDIFRSVIKTDRPLYKPGDTISVVSWLRGLDFGQNENNILEIPPDLEAFLMVKDSENEVVLEKTILYKDGQFTDKFEIDTEAKTGRYSIQIKVGDRNFYESFQVEHYQKPEILLDIQTDQTFVKPNTEVTARLLASHASGGNVKGVSLYYDWKLLGTKACFWFWYCPIETKIITSGESSTSLVGDWLGSVNVPLSLWDKKVNWNQLELNVSVQLEGHQRVLKKQTWPVGRSNLKATLKLSSSWASTGEIIKAEGKITDRKNEPLKENLIIELWQQGTDSEPNLVWKERITSLQNGIWQAKFLVPEKSGQYVVRLSHQNKNNHLQEEQFFWAHNQLVSAPKKDLADWQLVPSKQTYEVGDTVNVLLQNVPENIHLLEAFLVRGETLESLPISKTNQTISFPAKPWMAPNIYLQVLLENETDGTLKRFSKSAVINVFDPANKIEVDVRTNQPIYEPGTKATVFVDTIANGEPIKSEITLAVVDETLLPLKDFSGNLLYDQFYLLNPLGVQQYGNLNKWVSTKNIAQKNKQRLELKLSNLMPDGRGGGGGGEPEMALNTSALESDESGLALDNNRKNFLDTAYFKTTLETDENGQAKIEIPLPDNLTKWRVIAYVTAKETAFGQGGNHFEVGKKLSVTPLLPTTIRAGDEILAGFRLARSKDQEKGPVTVTINADPILKIAKSRWDIQLGQERTLYTPISILPETSFKEKKSIPVTIHVKGENNTDSIQTYITAYPVHEVISAVELLEIDQVQKLPIEVSEKSESSSIRLKTFSGYQTKIEALNIPDISDLEQKSTYELLEQMLYLASEKDSAKPRERLRKVLESRYTEKGWSSWNNGSKPSFEATLNTLWFHSFWPKSQYFISENQWNNAVDFLTQHLELNACRSRDYVCLTQAQKWKLVYVLSVIGETGTDTMAAIIPEPKNITAQLWYLMWYETVNPEAFKGALYNQIKQSLVVHDRTAFVNEGSELLNTILATQALEKVSGFKSVFKKLRHYIFTQPQKKYSPLEKSLMFYWFKSENTPLKNKQYELQYWLPEGFEEETVLKGKTSEGQSSFLYTHPDAKGLVFYNPAGDSYLSEIELLETFKAEDILPISKGFWLDVVLKDKQNKIVEETLKVGDVYTLKANILTRIDHNEVRLEMPIPAGFSVLNTALNQNSNSHREMGDFVDAACFGYHCVQETPPQILPDKVVYYFDSLPLGSKTIDLQITPKFKGDMFMPPASIKNVLQPEIQGYARAYKWLVE